MIQAAQSQPQTCSDVEACINKRDENQNLVWPIYSPLKASSRKPKYSPTRGGLGPNMPVLETWLSAQEMKIDVLLVLDAEFNTRHFLCLCWMLGRYWVRREPRTSLPLLCFYTTGHFSFIALPANLLVSHSLI